MSDLFPKRRLKLDMIHYPLDTRTIAQPGEPPEKYDDGRVNR